MENGRLVLARRAGETIVIGENIKVVLLEISGGNAKIGVVAPKNISVHREEIFNRIMEGKK